MFPRNAIGITTLAYTDSQSLSQASLLGSEEVRTLRGSSRVQELGPSREWSVKRPIGVSLEPEREAGRLVSSATIFLAGAECPFTCVFCDLFQYTIEGATPVGAISEQLSVGLEQLEALEESPDSAWGALKLYNASNFFDERAVPSADDGAIIEQVQALGAEQRTRQGEKKGARETAEEGPRLVVECHPRVLLGSQGKERCRRYAEETNLEVAIGLESVAPGGLQALNKSCTLEDVARAFEFVRSCGATVRAFVLFGIPTAAREGGFLEQEHWTLESLRWAKKKGARCATVIPVRGGNGAMEELFRLGLWQPPSLEQVESLFGEALQVQDAGFDVHLDVWDLEAVGPGCLGPGEAAACRARLRDLNAHFLNETVPAPGVRMREQESHKGGV